MGAISSGFIWWASATLLTAATFLIIRRYWEYLADEAYGAKHGCELPPELPKKWPLGVDRIIELWESNAQGRLLAFLCSIAIDYEPRNNLYQFLLIGPRAFHILHPKNVEVLLSTNFKDYNFGVRPQVFAPLLGNGIFTQQGPAWKHSRELLRKQFVRTKYQKLTNFGDHVENFFFMIDDSTVNGVVDLQPLFFNLTLDTATALLFGRSVYSLRANIDQDIKNKEFAQSFNIAQEGLAKRFRIAPFHFVYNPKEFQNACKHVHKFVDDYIKETQADEKCQSDPAFSFFNQVAAESASVIDFRYQLLNVLLAGRDTTACALSWTIRLLVRHPDALLKVQEEIFSVLGTTEIPTREDIKQLKFLDCVIKESLRLYPPVPLNNRTAEKTTILPVGGGKDGNSPMLVKKGELVVFSQYVNCRRRNLYGEDADDFRPERWETGELSHIGWAYFPFNGGPRQCLGEDFAMMQIAYTLVRLIQNFNLAMPDGEKIEKVGEEKQLLTLVLSSKDGCRVKISRRKF